MASQVFPADMIVGCNETAGLMFSFVVQLFDWAGLKISPLTLDVPKALPGSHMTSQQMASQGNSSIAIIE